MHINEASLKRGGYKSRTKKVIEAMNRWKQVIRLDTTR